MYLSITKTFPAAPILVPTPPIALPPSGGKPEQPIYLPIFPEHPIEILPPTAEHPIYWPQPPAPIGPEHPIYLPIGPTHPIELPPAQPPAAGQPGVPTQPIYYPVFPSHPIVPLPPSAEHPIYLPIEPPVSGGQPSHPIYYPVVPSHPIELPPAGAPKPEHPIYVPVVPSHPIVLPPAGGGGGETPEHPIVLPERTTMVHVSIGPGKTVEVPTQALTDWLKTQGAPSSRKR